VSLKIQSTSFFFNKIPSTIFWASITPDLQEKCSRIVLWMKLNESTPSLPLTLLNKIPLNNAYFLLSCISNISLISILSALTNTLPNYIILLATSSAYYSYSFMFLTVYLISLTYVVYLLNSLSKECNSN